MRRPTVRQLRHAALPLVALVLLAGCGSKALPPGDEIPGRTLTIYSSVPLQGASRVSGNAVVNGERLALAQVHDRIGKFRIEFKPLDDSTVQRAEWDPGQTSLNAHLAIQDPTTIGYIGDFNSGASAVSIPLLNRLGIPQVSPSNTAVGLTSGGPAVSPGEPQKYYPSGARNYVRPVPNDNIQAVAQVKLQRSQGCTKTYVLDDGEVDGQDSATSFSIAAQQAALQIAGVQSYDPRATDYAPLAIAVAQAGPDCLLISAITENNAVALTKQLAASLPHVKIFGMAGLAESTYTDPAQGGIPTDLDQRVMITVATLDPSYYPPAGRAFFDTYVRSYGNPEPYAIYGYESMSLMLAAISRATDRGTKKPRRSKVVGALFATRNTHSVLGTYSIDHNGDTTLRRYGAYRVLDGHLTFWSAIAAR